MKSEAFKYKSADKKTMIDADWWDRNKAKRIWKAIRTA